MSVLKALSAAFSPQNALVVPPPSATEERADLYVSAAGMGAFGLKYRDMKKLELKCRTETHSATVGDAEQLVVVAERWSKQSVSTSIKCPKLDKCNERLSELAAEIAPQVPAELTALLLAGGASAVAVAKRRWSVSLALRPPKMQTVEVAELTLTFPAGQQRAPLRVLSLCVEGGKGEAMSRDLLAINGALKAAHLDAFTGGYPAFLAFEMNKCRRDEEPTAALDDDND